MQGLIVLLIVGAIAGWLAGYIASRDTAFNIMDVILGVVGAIVGGYIASALFDTAFGALTPMGIAIATLGALLVAFIYKKVTGKSIA